MPHPAGKKEEGRARILASAGKAFRSRGYGGAGIDGLAKDAGVTSGAFYAHFANKDAAFQAAMLAGMQELRDGVVAMRKAHGTRWIERFIDFYIEKRRCDLRESCALQSLSGEVARTGAETRSVYQQALHEVVDAVAEGIGGGSRKQRRAEASALLALLAGGVSMARAAEGEAFNTELVKALRKAALAIVSPPARSAV